MWNHHRVGESVGALLIRAIERYQLQILLWLLWTLAVVITASVSWSQAPRDLLGLVLHCLIAGLLGQIVITTIEMRLQPERFEADEPPGRATTKSDRTYE